MTDGERLNIAASKYQSATTIVTPSGEAQRLVLPKDPRRFYVEFRGFDSSSYPKPYPQKIPDGATAGETEDSPRIYKFHDCPGLVTGEWYILTTDALQILEIITDTYIGP